MASTTRALRTKITVKLGLVQFDVKLYSAREGVESATTVCLGTEDAPHQLTKTCEKLSCPNCQGTTWANFRKAMNVGGDDYVLLPPDMEFWSEDELKALGGSIELNVHEAAEVENSTLPGEKLYYMAPQSVIAAQAYALMVDRVLVRTDRAFVFEFAVKGVPAFYRLGVVNGALVAKELCRPEMVRAVPVIEPASFTAEHVKLADDAIASVLTKFDPADHSDQRKAKIEAYVATQQPTVAVGGSSTDNAEPAPVLDLMASLQASIDAAKPKKAPRKRAPRKAPAKAAPAAKVPTARSARQKVS